MSDQAPHTIQIAAALINDDKGRLLVVRKVGTEWFMQAGGKIENGESPLSALRRELSEEIGLMAMRATLVVIPRPPPTNQAILSKQKSSMCGRNMTLLRDRKLKKPFGSITSPQRHCL